MHNLLEAGGTHVVEYGAEGKYLGNGGLEILQIDESYFPTKALPQDSPGKTGLSRFHGVYLQDLWQMSQSVEAELGLRFDNFVAHGPEDNAIRIDENRWSPRAAVTFRPWPGSPCGGSGTGRGWGSDQSGCRS